ncbi:MAG: tetratricopeptide repeat protein, partial [Actinobacteria bacterium]|nr:tetratricopeptide repeat protein [Actinomycetota bacterium]
LRLGAALWRFYSLGRISEGRRLIGLAVQSSEGCPVDLARSLNGLGVLARSQGDLEVAAATFAEARRRAAAVGAAKELALAVLNEGIVAEAQGAYDIARVHFHKAMAVSREVGDSRGIGHALNCLGVISLRFEDRLAASERFLAAIGRFRALNDSCSVAITATNLGWIAETDGELAEARQWYEETLQIWKDAGDEHGRAQALADLGRLARRVRDFSRARPLLEEALGALYRLGDRRMSAACLLELAGISLERNRRDLAGRLLGAAEAVRQSMGTPAWPDERGLEEEVFGDLCDTLGIVAAGRARAIGRAMQLEDAVDMVESDVWPPAVRRRSASRAATGQAPWEAQPIALAAAVGAVSSY